MANFMFIWDPATGRSGPLCIRVGSYTQDQAVGSRQLRVVPSFNMADPRVNAFSWTVNQVADWLRASKAPEEVVAAFAREDIDGSALRELSCEELKLLVPALTLGARLRLERQLSELRTFVDDAERHREVVDAGEYRFHIEDVNVKVPLTSPSLLSLLSALQTERVIPRIALVTYTGEAIDRWGRVDDDASDKHIPHGIPFFLHELRNARVMGMDLEIEDKLTASVYLNAQVTTVATVGLRDQLQISMRTHLSNMGIVADELDSRLFVPDKFNADLAMGVAVVFDSERRKSTTIEFGRHVSWSPKTHRIYPALLKHNVFQLLLCHSRPENPIARLPRDVLLMIVKMVAHDFDASPFSCLPPCPSGKKAGNAEDDEMVPADEPDAWHN